MSVLIWVQTKLQTLAAADTFVDFDVKIKLKESGKKCKFCISDRYMNCIR